MLQYIWTEREIIEDTQQQFFFYSDLPISAGVFPAMKAGYTNIDETLFDWFYLW